MRTLQEEMSLAISNFQSFRIGGRGICADFYYQLNGYWRVEIPRCHAAFYEIDRLTFEHGCILLWQECGSNYIGFIDLKEYTKFTEVKE